MNKENLLKLREFLPNIPQEKLHMGIFRRLFDFASHICNSVGCIVGHSTQLDDGFEDPEYFRGSKGDINFYLWAKFFYDPSDSEWYFLFGPQWYYHDNTIEGAIKRIDYVLAGNNVEDFKYSDFKEGW